VRARTPRQHLTTLDWLLHNPKETHSFFSRRWNAGTNPDLAFASLGQDSRLPDRRVLGKFLRSQHRPSLTTPPKYKVPAHSDPVKRWNFRKADWKRFCLLTRESAKGLPPPDTPDIGRAYQDFCESLLSAAKQCILRGRRKNYVTCWDQEYQTLYRSFIRAPVGTASDRVASSLLSRLQQKKQERWEEAVNSIDFSHSSRRRGEQSTNLLAGLDPPACAPSRQISSPRNWRRTGHTRLLIASPPGSSTRSCPTYGRFQHL